MPQHSDDASTILRGSPARTSSDVHRVIVEQGPDAGLVVTLGTSYLRTLMGTSQACQIRLADREVSRRHLAFELTPRGLKVTDLDSTNGTYVQGVRVEAVYLSGGERIELGSTRLRVEKDEKTLPPTPTTTRTNFGRVVGTSPQMRELYTLCERVSPSDLAVMIEGETGTGKEVLAEAIHEASPRQGGPFVVFDCTAVAPNLAESELFGHERGAFTGATATRKGVFEQADGGTLFIDEIGDLDSSLQPKLLRALERSEIRRVGGDRWQKVSVRVISATRRDMDHEVQSGRFRDDLFFRLAVARLELPPLRSRTGDVLVLLEHFWRAFGGQGAVPYEVQERFERHHWPGNVRELRNSVARQLALGDDFAITRDPEAVSPGVSENDFVEQIIHQDLPYPRARDMALAAFERRYIARVLAQHGGKVAKAAAASGIARRYFNLLLARQK